MVLCWLLFCDENSECRYCFVMSSLIEDVFYLVNAVGIKNVSIIIAPYDMRKGRKPELEKSPLQWYDALCSEIESSLKQDMNRL